MSEEGFRVQSYTAAGFGENGYIVRCADGRTAIAIDPGGEAAAMAADVGAEGLVLEAVLLTHAHMDHVEGVAELVRRTGAPVYLHPADRPLYDAVVQQGQYFGVQVEPPPPVDRPLEAGSSLTFGGTSFEVRFVPGHSPGHVLLYVAAAGVAFIGDVVFQGSIGRTDLPGGDYRQLMESIRDQVLTLPDETVLYTGHGPATTVGHERIGNPFLAPHFGGGLA
jgi:hydroxyacylglutathione hydrolase